MLCLIAIAFSGWQFFVFRAQLETKDAKSIPSLTQKQSVAIHLTSISNQVGVGKIITINTEADAQGMQLGEVSLTITYPNLQMQFIKATSDLAGCASSFKQNTSDGNIQLSCTLASIVHAPQIESLFSLEFKAVQNGYGVFSVNQSSSTINTFSGNALIPTAIPLYFSVN